MALHARPPAVTFLGGTGTVTGSKFVFESEESQVLVDCGLFQGLAPLRRRNWRPPPLDLDRLTAVVLTHAHLDHCGYLPVLVRNGWRGPIFCTPGTADLAAIVLADSAHLMVEDAAQANEGGWTRHHPALPLYDQDDAAHTTRLFQPIDFGDSRFAAKGVEFEFGRAGTSSARRGRTSRCPAAKPWSAATWAVPCTGSSSRRNHVRRATCCCWNPPTGAATTTTRPRPHCWPTRSAAPSVVAAAC
jgi:hypothetical protein